MSSRNTAAFGSASGIQNVLTASSQHHRRTSSVKRDSSAASSRLYSTPQHSQPQSSSAKGADKSRFDRWQFPISAASSTASSPATSSSSTLSDANLSNGPSPDTSPDSYGPAHNGGKLVSFQTLPSLYNADHRLMSIQENNISGSSSDDSEQEEYDESPSRARSVHRASPSLPYPTLPTTHYLSSRVGGGLGLEAAGSSTGRHLSPRQLLRFVTSHIRRARFLDLSYGVLFLASFIVFALALSGIGYQAPSDITAIPFPPAQVGAVHSAYVPAAAAVPQASSMPDQLLQARDDEAIAEGKVFRPKVQPLRPPGRQTKDLLPNGPLVITEDPEDEEEDRPAWARPKQAPKPVVAPKPVAPVAPVVVVEEAVQEEVVAAPVIPALEQAARRQGPARIYDDDVPAPRAPIADIVVEEHDENVPDLVADSPSDVHLNDEHAAHNHHPADQNIFDKAATLPDDHVHHGEEHLEQQQQWMPVEQADVVDEDEDDGVPAPPAAEYLEPHEFEDLTVDTDGDEVLVADVDLQ